MYNEECDVVSVHLYDGETEQYNVLYVKRILVSQPFIMINL
jgi:putative molybdopterin biosynthesis protein